MEMFEQLTLETHDGILLSSVGSCKTDSTLNSLPWETRRLVSLVDRSKNTLGRIHSIHQAWRC